MKKYQHYIDARGEVLPTPHRSLNNLVKNGSFRNKENLQYKKTANSGFIEPVGKMNNFHAP